MQSFTLTDSRGLTVILRVLLSHSISGPSSTEMFVVLPEFDVDLMRMIAMTITASSSTMHTTTTATMAAFEDPVKIDRVRMREAALAA